MSPSEAAGPDSGPTASEAGGTGTNHRNRQTAPRVPLGNCRTRGTRRRGLVDRRCRWMARVAALRVSCPCLVDRRELLLSCYCGQVLVEAPVGREPDPDDSVPPA